MCMSFSPSSFLILAQKKKKKKVNGSNYIHLHFVGVPQFHYEEVIVDIVKFHIGILSLMSHVIINSKSLGPLILYQLV